MPSSRQEVIDSQDKCRAEFHCGLHHRPLWTFQDNDKIDVIVRNSVELAMWPPGHIPIRLSKIEC
jgi:hypothetical protein